MQLVCCLTVVLIFLEQTDTTYFTAPGGKQPAPGNPKPSKPTSKAAAPASAPPPDLLTPQELAASSRSAPLSKGKTPEKAPTINGDASSSHIADPVAPVIPQKRRPDDGEDPQPGPSGAHKRQNSHPKPKPKRPKPQPSLFIPKKVSQTERSV